MTTLSKQTIETALYALMADRIGLKDILDKAPLPLPFALVLLAEQLVQVDSAIAELRGVQHG